MEPSTTKIRLDEVTWMRTILAILIVFMHAFTCYNHSWDEPVGFVEIPLYKWICRSSFAFTLESFVFISGYLYAFQRITLKREGGGKNLVVSKLKRLIIPSLIFSALYFPLFYEYKGIPDLVYNLINGCGHMWFLPMLFWCFLGGWLIEKVKIDDKWKLLFLVALNLFSLIPLPFRLTNASIFLLYFYGGYVVYKNKEFIDKIITRKSLIIGWLVFVLLFIIFRPLRDNSIFIETSSVLSKAFANVFLRSFQLIYASAGVLVFYCTSVYYLKSHVLKSLSIKLAASCFGIYLFQQFVLKILYYKTPFSSIVGPYWLPWIGFIVAIILSYFFTSAMLKTKIGKKLVG